jgi:hypothetical protein
MNRYAPSPCTITRADGTCEIDTRTVRVFVPRDERIRQTPILGKNLTVHTQYFVLHRAHADAFKGSRSALKSMRNLNIRGVFETAEAAEQCIIRIATKTYPDGTSEVLSIVAAAYRIIKR